MTDSEFAPGEDARPPFAVAGVAATEAAELLEIVTSRAADFSRKAADDLYECLLLATQDYLIENSRFNIGERIASAERQARHDREAWGKAEARLRATVELNAEMLRALRQAEAPLRILSEELASMMPGTAKACASDAAVCRAAIAKAEARDQ